jgi:hypothetical protein
MILSMMNMICSLFYWCILSCKVPLPRDVRPPDIPFRVVFCIGVGWCMKSSIYGVTQHDAPESFMVCDVSLVHVFVAIMVAILSSSLFCKFERCCNDNSSLSSDAVSWLYRRGMFGDVIRKYVR